MQPVGLVILAAGGSTRLGHPKQLVAYQGRSLLRHATEVAVGSLCHPVVVVLGAHAAALETEVRDLPVRVTENRDWVQGMATSLRRGLQVLEDTEPDIGAAVITLCDQPCVSPRAIDALVEAYRSGVAPIVASAYDGILGVPALFDRRFFPELLALEGEAGARRVIARHPRRVHAVLLPGGGQDIDTPQDCERLQTGTG
jgi:molybdenum cofactor cytidylyltransferase